MIVAEQKQDATGRGGALQIGMLDRISRTIHAGTLAVPDAEDSIHFRAGNEVELLRASERGHRQVFVQVGLEDDVIRLQRRSGLPQFHVVSAKGRAAVAADESGGVQSRTPIHFALNDGQADQCLAAAEQRLAALQRVLVLQSNLGH